MNSIFKIFNYWIESPNELNFFKFFDENTEFIMCLPDENNQKKYDLRTFKENMKKYHFNNIKISYIDKLDIKLSGAPVSGQYKVYLETYQYRKGLGLNETKKGFYKLTSEFYLNVSFGGLVKKFQTIKYEKTYLGKEIVNKE